MRGSWGPESTTQGEWARAEARAPRMKSCPSPRPSQPAVPSSGILGNTGQVPFSACSPGSGCGLLHCWPHTALGVGGRERKTAQKTEAPSPLILPCPSREGASRQRCQPEGRGRRSPGHGARPTCSPLRCIGTRDPDVVDASWFGWFFVAWILTSFFVLFFVL